MTVRWGALDLNSAFNFHRASQIDDCLRFGISQIATPIRLFPTALSADSSGPL
jgi:hypothetical protein